MSKDGGEEELRGVDTKPLVGHLAAWNYFESLKNARTVVTNDPREATYIGIHRGKQTVEKAKSTDTDKVIAAMAGQSFKAPSGFAVKMDEPEGK